MKDKSFLKNKGFLKDKSFLKYKGFQKRKSFKKVQQHMQKKLFFLAFAAVFLYFCIR